MQDFKLGGAHLKKLRRAEGGAKIFGIFRVKNHDFTPKNHIFSNFRGGARRVRPPLDPPPVLYAISTHKRSSYGFGWIATTK
jgi:hypothetical protein